MTGSASYECAHKGLKVATTRGLLYARKRLHWAQLRHCFSLGTQRNLSPTFSSSDRYSGHGEERSWWPFKSEAFVDSFEKIFEAGSLCRVYTNLSDRTYDASGIADSLISTTSPLLSGIGPFEAPDPPMAHPYIPINQGNSLNDRLASNDANHNLHPQASTSSSSSTTPNELSTSSGSLDDYSGMREWIEVQRVNDQDALWEPSHYRSILGDNLPQLGP